MLGITVTTVTIVTPRACTRDSAVHVVWVPTRLVLQHCAKEEEEEEFHMLPSCDKNGSSRNSGPEYLLVQQTQFCFFSVADFVVHSLSVASAT